MTRLRKVLLAFSLLFVFLLTGISNVVPPAHADYTPFDPAVLGKEIDDFLGAGATGYLVWQYSGSRSAPFGNDQYSFFQDVDPGPAICAMLKTKAGQYPDKFVGVNMWDAGLHVGELPSHFSWLKNNCGVKVVRVFAKVGDASLMAGVLGAAQGAGIQVIIAIGDYSNGGGGVPQGAGIDWYQSGYQGEYKSFAKSILSATGGNSALYGYELANEPHCGGNLAALPAYKAWGQDIGSMLKSGSPRVGYGQMASQDATRCDSPRTPEKDFTQTNSASAISITSAHYYTADEKASAMAALAQSKAIGKPFYIGEAGFPGGLPGGAGPSAPMYIFPGIDDQKTQALKEQMAANYTLTCGSQLTLGPLILNESQVDKADASGPQGPTYINTVDGDCSGTRCLVRDVIGTAFINYSGTTIPLFRFQGADVPDPERSSRRLDDLEGFFGAAYTKQQIAQGAKAAAGYDRLHPIANGVFEHLASKQTECQDRIDFLKSIQQACSAPLPSVNAINNTPPPGWSAAITNGRCALDQAIPNTAYSYVSLYNSKPSNFSCDSTKIDRSGSWYQAFAKVETTMPLGFKPAYIVEYFDDVKFDPQTDADLNFYANWFSPIDPNLNPPVPPDGTPYGAGNESQYGLSKLHQRIRVVKVYVPTGFSVSKPLENPSPETARIPTTNYDSGLMHVMKSLMDSDTQKTVEKQAEQDIKTLWSRIKQGTGMMNPAPFSDEFIKCFECVDIDSGGSTIESILVKRINAQGVSPAIGDLEDPTCQADDLLGEKADQRKQQINPIPNPDPVNEIGIRAKATLRAKAEKMPLYENVKIRTYLLLPEEYRNITNYETNFLNVFVPAPSPLQSPPTQFNFAWREKDNSSGKRPWKYLQLNDTKPKNGAANSVFVSSPQVQGNLIGYNVTYDASGNQNQTPVYLQGEIVGPDLQKFDINPQVPGGKLARALWELVCNLTRGPIPGKKTVPYKGFETILTQGPSACVTAATPSPSQPPEGVIDQYLLQEVAKCDGKSGGITAGGGIPLVYSSYQCSSSDPTDLASRFSAPPADVPDLTIPEWKNGTDGTAAICNEDFYSFVACTYSPARKAPYPALIAHKVDSSGKFDPNGTMTACQYVVQQAKAEGVSPRFALSMWGEESGFSSYASKTDGNDFGVVSIPPSRQSGTIASQLSAFLNTCNSHSTYQSFMRDYSGEITPDQNDFCNNKYFPYRIKDFYNYIPQR